MKDGNKRIMKNTVMLYIRMLLIMFVTFYTSRIVLQKLGVQDYGIYNVVGGVVSMLAFLNSTLSATCQRYFSYELGRNDKKKLAELFRLNLTVFIYFILLVFLLAETVGLWFINTQLVIPMERLYAMNWVYQFSILTFMVSSLSVPYNALIISHERMSIYAYISILEVLLKLGVVFLLGLIAIDNLILYGLLLFLSTGIITFFYYLYCHFNYPESRYSYYWKSDEIREVASYSTWHFLGSISNVLRGQGVNILLNMFFSPVINAARAIAFQVNMGVYTLMNNFFTAVKPQIYNSPQAKTLENISKNISFEHVDFSYTPDKPVLKDICFTVPTGKTIAFVGNSGGGKSTLVNLLPRFYDVCGGAIKFDGVDIRNFTLESLRNAISVVFQDNFVFSGTIRDNILVGNENASEEDIQKALKMAHLDEFVYGLEKGLDTDVGEKGTLLSGGQRQRLAIARAFLKNSQIVVLDEATSALDNKAEAMVQKAIDNLMKDRTVFVIAHRLSTVQNADMIMVVNAGQIVEQGRHVDFLNIENGAYRALYNAQFKNKK